MVYFNADSIFVEKLLLIQSYLTIPEVFQSKEKNNYLTTLICQKMPKHPIFNEYSKTCIELFVNELSLATPVFEKDRNFLITLANIQYCNPVDDKTTFGVEKLSMERSNY